MLPHPPLLQPVVSIAATTGFRLFRREKSSAKENPLYSGRNTKNRVLLSQSLLASKLCRENRTRLPMLSPAFLSPSDVLAIAENEVFRST